MMHNSIDPSSAQQGIKRYTAEQQRAAQSVIYKGAHDIQAAARKRLVWRRGVDGPGGRFTGRLAGSIAVNIKDRGLAADIGPGVKYAKHVEGVPQPPRRQFVPFSIAPELRIWLERHGVPVPPNAKGWMVGGERSSTPFMRPAAEEQIPKILKLAESRLRPR
jgi:hypothetical protein